MKAKMNAKTNAEMTVNDGRIAVKTLDPGGADAEMKAQMNAHMNAEIKAKMNAKMNVNDERIAVKTLDP